MIEDPHLLAEILSYVRSDVYALGETCKLFQKIVEKYINLKLPLPKATITLSG